MTSHFPRHAMLLLAFLPLMGAHAGGLPGQDPVRDAENARQQLEAIHRRMSALPAACTLGSAQARKGNWITAFRSMPEPGNPDASIYLFDTAPATGAVRAGLNRAALEALAKIEFRDAGGEWHDAGPVAVHEAPAGCDYVWLQQDLGGTRQVSALRYTLQHRLGQFTVSDVAVLK